MRRTDHAEFTASPCHRDGRVRWPALECRTRARQADRRRTPAPRAVRPTWAARATNAYDALQIHLYEGTDSHKPLPGANPRQATDQENSYL